MSDDPTDDPDESPDEEAPEEPEETPEEGGDEEDDRPPIEDDERADVDLSGIAEEINEEEAEETPTEEGSESADADTDDDTQEEGGEEGQQTPANGSTWGDMYVETLAVLLPEIAAEMSGEETDMDAEEVVDLATKQPVELDAKFDAVVADMDGMEEMSDKQALLLSTAIVCGTVLLKEGDVAGDVIGRVSEEVSA